MHRLTALAALLLLGAALPFDDPSLRQAQAEVARAAAEENQLNAAAGKAGSEAARLAGQQRAAAAAIASAEARIGAAEIIVARAQAEVTQRQARLVAEQAPIAGLLAGLVTMGRRPPLLAMADGSTEEFVRVRALLDATMPAIRARTAALANEIEAGRRAALNAADARDRLAQERTNLQSRKVQFVALEQRALARQSSLSGQALSAGDTTLAGGETLTALGDEVSRRRSAMRSASELALLDPLPARPGIAQTVRATFNYRLPVDAPLRSGLGTVDANGIRSRGITLAASRGAPVVVPADGTIAFAGPFRRADGIVIIDHGRGWTTLIVNVATTLPKGTRVRMGDALGRALGPVEIDLTHNSAPVSPSFIAASSDMLSNSPKGG